MATIVRDEQPADAAAIRAVTKAAFEGMPYSQQTEAAIVDALRAAGALSLSLVAVEGDAIVGHVAFSPVTVDGVTVGGWYGVGPVSVRPDRQRSGIGKLLMTTGLERLRRTGGAGCVLVGDPGYYRRFGFSPDPSLVYPGLPAEYFQMLKLGAAAPKGEVAFHPAFEASDA